MNIKLVECGNKWGILEKFKVSRYFNKYRVYSLSKLATEPYIKRGDNFIPLSVIDEEMGIEKYIKAKKPFYSILEGETPLVLCVFSFDGSDFVKETSQVRVLYPQLIKGNELICKDIVVDIDKFFKSNEKFVSLLIESKDSREDFLRGRIKEYSYGSKEV